MYYSKKFHHNVIKIEVDWFKIDGADLEKHRFGKNAFKLILTFIFIICRRNIVVALLKILHLRNNMYRNTYLVI